MKRILLAAVGLAVMAAATGAAGAAGAADLSQPAPYYKAPPYAAPAFYNWTGFYLGVNGGGAFGNSSWSAAAPSFNTSGGMVGGQLGYNWQFGQFVYGLEGDIDWTGIHGAANVGVCGVAACQTNSDFLSTVRGRVGFAADRFLPYVTGGLAVGNIRASDVFGGINQTNAGWTVGAGVEFAIAGPWTAKVEYLFTDLGNAACNAPCGAPLGNNVSLTDNVVRAGINYRF